MGNRAGIYIEYRMNIALYLLHLNLHIACESSNSNKFNRILLSCFQFLKMFSEMNTYLIFGCGVDWTCVFVRSIGVDSEQLKLHKMSRKVIEPHFQYANHVFLFCLFDSKIS